MAECDVEGAYLIGVGRLEAGGGRQSTSRGNGDLGRMDGIVAD